MYIIHVATEISPVAKVGGLGDVIHGLAKATAALDRATIAKVEIIIPKYDCIDYVGLKNLAVETPEFWANGYRNTMWSAETDGLKLLLLEPHHPSFYFSRGSIYGCPDDIERFTYFSLATLNYLAKVGKRPDIIHIHDWATALIAPLHKGLAKGIVYTIHNLEHQGKCAPTTLSRLGIPAENFLTPTTMQDPISPGLINLMKGGIEYADFVTTVSPTYEKEIKTVQGGCGLHTVLLKHEKKLKGILNGIDEEFWDPSKDNYLVSRFSKENFSEGKLKNKKQLRTHLGLLDEHCPLIGCVTRLVPQKGPQLIAHAIRRTVEKGGQFVLLGSSPSDDIDKMFKELQAEFAATKKVAICLDRDEALAHLIFAGCDMITVPSLFEPCGLTQLIALKYGAIPIVRATGGLADTVFDIDTSPLPETQRNGFTFDDFDTGGVDWALNRALELYKNEQKWRQLVLQGMSIDFSWKHSVPEYVAIYKKLFESFVDIGAVGVDILDARSQRVGSTDSS